MPGNDQTESSSLPSSSQSPEEVRPGLLSHITSPRARKQLGIFVAGASFFLFSTIITRRALFRKYKASIPGFYHPSNLPKANVHGPIEAVEALSLATINVTSAAMMLTGGALWAMDVSSLDDMRKIIRGGLGVDGSGRSETEAEEELEEWLATVLARKDDKERRAKDGKGRPDRGEESSDGSR
ncbi:MAG: Potassium channel [Chaenotheca gracillima]|nr:MAG: Potassium channel [Chaenotheca gracillima]